MNDADSNSGCPEAVGDQPARKAAAAGQSMQSYLLGELTRLAERPTMAEIVKRAQARAKASGSSVRWAMLSPRCGPRVIGRSRQRLRP